MWTCNRDLIFFYYFKMLRKVLILAALATIVTAVTIVPYRPTIIPAVCLEEKVTGRCNAYIPSWYYNTKTGQCKLFVYGGCDGNGNRFPSKEECEKTCQDPCKLPKLVGPCLALIPRYYYSQTVRKCVLFNYGGCGGNANNFVSLQQCEKQCKGNDQ